jgi:hypothetical protein
MTLYVFITHQKNINNCYETISEMMDSDFIIVQGGFIKNEYDEEKRILNLNCNDGYAGLPEKVMKTFHFLISDDRFNKYTHFCKLDDDMKVTKRFENIEGDYLGNVHYVDGSRNWHMGRCGNFWDKVPYMGEFTPWCMGGFGYVVSRNALEKALPNFNYLDHIYEDLYIGILLKSVGIEPKMINTKEHLVSPDH